MCSGLCVKGQPQLRIARYRIQSAVDKLFPQLILDNHDSLSREYPSHLLEPKRLTDLLGSGGLNTWGLCCNPGFLTCSSASSPSPCTAKIPQEVCSCVSKCVDWKDIILPNWIGSLEQFWDGVGKVKTCSSAAIPSFPLKFFLIILDVRWFGRAWASIWWIGR